MSRVATFGCAQPSHNSYMETCMHISGRALPHNGDLTKQNTTQSPKRTPVRFVICIQHMLSVSLLIPLAPTSSLGQAWPTITNASEKSLLCKTRARSCSRTWRPQSPRRWPNTPHKAHVDRSGKHCTHKANTLCTALTPGGSRCSVANSSHKTDEQI